MTGSEEDSSSEGRSGPHSYSEVGAGGGELSGESPAEVIVNLARELGASKDLSSQVLRLYIPNKDREGNEFGCQRRWVLEAAELLTKIGGGATILPPAEGHWFDEKKQQTIRENPILIYSYVNYSEFLKYVRELRSFVHRLGRETGQEEVVLEFDRDFYRISSQDYDPNPATESSHEEPNQGYQPAPDHYPGDEPKATTH